jgi:hypothetical protein
LAVGRLRLGEAGLTLRRPRQFGMQAAPSADVARVLCPVVMETVLEA